MKTRKIDKICETFSIKTELGCLKTNVKKATGDSMNLWVRYSISLGISLQAIASLECSTLKYLTKQHE